MSQYHPYGAPSFPGTVQHGGEHLPKIAHLLAPGEQVRGIVDTDLCDLIRRPPRRYRKAHSGGVAEVGLGCLFVLVNLGEFLAYLVEDCTWGVIRMFRRLFRGRGLIGGWRSQAGQFVVAVRSADGNYENDDVLMVFTDRRILLAGRGGSRTLRALGELPYAQLVRVEPRHTWLSNRADLHFADGSKAALEIIEKELNPLVALGPR
ncbi:hypothetical protein [Kitasatospora sp. NPDC048407]|uniref:hypothetical protein n=1 Tax=Kitasatospora sp. NPDC048407 TaxID=3364051 RepID=UPI00371C62DE